ncbi:ribonuclease [Paraburkholderia sp. MMS20-SJTR3]|uniref:Ribonuclease n=1 Tax=Paraburkholderia sejongensis TaxID=2886946 RepID=A0ABS8K1R4_9BURK|nr:ribonuclease [Paraburkholderia sp. MMS20-SJTR3]MCC8396086.1 ribonuclease [Paraburkholderia sp. MMS20-SJTR3]
MKRAWVFSCIVAVSVIAGGCGKQGSGNGTEASGASAADAPGSAASGASGPIAASGPQPAGMLGSIAKAQLPAEAAETLRLIKAGGPFPFSEDGVMFRNSAGLLPQHPRGYYRTYTVRTPGATDRGLRRIVCGGPRKQIGDCYYTEDYYVSFKRISD